MTKSTAIEIVASELLFPEGPVAMADGSVLLVEIARGTLTSIDVYGHVDVVAELGGGPNGVAIGPDGKAYVCNNGGFGWRRTKDTLRTFGCATDKTYSCGRIECVDLKTGHSEVLYEGSEHGTLNGPNDIVFDSNGGFWFTDLGKYRERSLDLGAVYYAKTDGSHIERAIYPLITPNGIGLSPDGDTLYVAETHSARLWQYPVTSPGKVSVNQDSWTKGTDLTYAPAGYQLFDSLALEANGNICIGTLIAGGISTVSPSGELVSFVKMPDTLPTNICFGGPDCRTAYVTLSSTGRLAKLSWPRTGMRLNW